MLRAALVCGAGVCLAAVTVAVPATAAAESVTAHVATAHPTVGQDLEIDGQVTGASSSSSTVTVTRDDAAGQGQSVGMPVMTNADGTFTVTDQPPVRGNVTYHVNADAGAATTDVSTSVAGKQATLTIHVSPAPADVQSTVHVLAHLGDGPASAELTLYAKPYGGSRQQFDQGQVDANGDRTADRVVHRRTTFIAAFAGDNAYAPASARVSLRVRAVITERLRGWFRASGGTKIYHRTDNPALAVHLLPEHKDECIYFRAQHKSHGEWVRSAVSSCVHTDATGRAIGVLRGPGHIAGVPYRLRAEWNGTKAIGGRKGTWMHLEFR